MNSSLIEGIMKHQLINEFPLGNNISEVLRIVDALQYFKKKSEVYPAN
ncbi:MAG: hypothetical protein ACMUEM_05320 [Flavobacteriales bacterium AspAUS03]